jgi:hypothetical protein
MMLSTPLCHAERSEASRHPSRQVLLRRTLSAWVWLPFHRFDYRLGTLKRQAEQMLCHTAHIHQHCVFAGQAARGKTSVGWFFGAKFLLFSRS